MRKKLIGIVAVAMLLVGASSCGNSTSKEVKSAEETAEKVDDAVGKPIELGENDILEFDGPIPAPVVVDFSASWCPPCKQLHPIFNKLARKYHGKVKFIYVDVDKAPQLARQYGVESVPTLLFVNQQGVIDRSIGFMTEEELEGAVKSIMPDPNAAPTNSPR